MVQVGMLLIICSALNSHMFNVAVGTAPNTPGTAPPMGKSWSPAPTMLS